MNTIVVSAINHSEMGVIGTNLANELGHHLVPLIHSSFPKKPPFFPEIPPENRGAEPVETMASSPLCRDQESTRGDDQKISSMPRQPQCRQNFAGFFLWKIWGSL
jgi:hypothetical protein